VGRCQLQGSAAAQDPHRPAGQLTADVYGKKVEYKGTVAGLGVGTGAAFSLLPAQNATGNWIKVVQRVPVRVALDPKRAGEHPLRVGLSMEARSTSASRTARRWPTRRAPAAATQTQVFETAGRRRRRRSAPRDRRQLRPRRRAPVPHLARARQARRRHASGRGQPRQWSGRRRFLGH
jgi:membrane fusion protein (multidrug efflux system)